jgi:hypothetical protein
MATVMARVKCMVTCYGVHLSVPLETPIIELRILMLMFRDVIYLKN